MCVVYVCHGTVLSSQFNDPICRCYVAVHAEDTVSDDKDVRVAFLLGIGEHFLQVFWVAMLVDGSVGFTQPYAVNYASMIELIADYEIPFACKLRNQSRVCSKTR